MAFILNKKYVGKKGSYLLFISNRFLRIYPIYWAIILLTIVFSVAMLWRGIDTGDIAGFLRSYASLLHGHILMLPVVLATDFIHYFTLIVHCGYFTRCSDPNKGLNTVAMAWILNLELLFYLIAPFFLRKKGIARLGAVAGVFLLWFIVFHFRLLSFYSEMYAFLHALKLFMLGFISFILYEKLSLKKIPRSDWLVSAYCFSLLFLCTPISRFPTSGING